MKTQSQIEKEIENLTNGEYSVVGEYKGMIHPLLLQHNTCNFQWSPTPKKFIHDGTRCPQCARERQKKAVTKTEQQFLEDLNRIWDNEYELVSPYINNYSKVKVLHHRCNKVIEIEPRTLLRGSGCQECAKLKNKLSQEEVINRINDLGNNEYRLLSIYQNISKKLQIQHTCGHIFEMSLKVFQQGGRCPQCYGKHSHGEYEIMKMLESNNIKFKTEVTFPNLKSNGGGALRFDFGIYDDQENLIKLIEFDGKQHSQRWAYRQSENEFVDLQIRDWLKNKYCIENNIPLLRIRYNQPFNIDYLLEEETFANIQSVDLISIDQATTSGIAFWKNNNLIDFTTKTIDDKLSDGKRLSAFKEYFEQLIKENYPQKIVFEAVLGPEGDGPKGFRTFQLLCWYQSMLIILCEQYQIPYDIIIASTWKKTLGVTGKYRRDQKASCKEIINRLLKIESEDACDAIGIGYHYIEQNKPERSAF